MRLFLAIALAILTTGSAMAAEGWPWWIPRPSPASTNVSATNWSWYVATSNVNMNGKAITNGYMEGMSFIDITNRLISTSNALNSVVGVEPLWYVRNYNSIVLHKGDTLIGTDMGWWKVDDAGNTTPRDTLFDVADYCWTTNSEGHIIPR